MSSTETKRTKTKICCLNLDPSCLNFLKDKFDIYDGTLGHPINVSGKNFNGLNLLLNYKLPENIHEYEIFIEDMTEPETIPYDIIDNTRKNVFGSKAYYFKSYDPQTIFDPCPYTSSILKDILKENRNRPVIKIAFQAPRKIVEYIYGDIHNLYSHEKRTCSNYEHIAEFCSSSLTGYEVKLCDNELSKILFESFLDDVSYGQMYYHPKTWNNNADEYVNNSHFTPLLISKSGGIVSYLWITDNDITLVLPQTKRKKELLQRVMNEFLFKYFSEYFPEVEASSWLNLPIYYLPNQEQLLKEKEELKAKYKENLLALDKRIDSNNKEYSFLHKLLTATGDELVKSCIEFFKWLGFESVIDKDKKLDKGFNEEDIQIESGDKGLLLIEIKGINGTSTDAQCSQIFKNVFRRREEQQRFDVFGLYIVNNERHIEPLSRTIPPFNKQQIKDAENEKRGLCYTWQLFNLYFEIKDAIITKQEARDILFNTGLVDFSPRLLEVGIPYRYFKRHSVVCLEITDIKISVGDSFYYKEHDRWKKVKILTIKDGDKEFGDVTNGKYGFELEGKCPYNLTFYVKQ